MARGLKPATYGQAAFGGAELTGQVVARVAGGPSGTGLPISRRQILAAPRRQ